MKHFLKIALASLLLAPLAHAQLTLSGGSGGGGSSCTFATPYIICGGVTADRNFTPVVKPASYATFTNIDASADTSGNFAWADATHAATGLPAPAAPIGTTNGEILITGPLNNEVDLHYVQHFGSPVTSIDEEFSLNDSMAWLNHSANGGLIALDCVNNLLILYQVYGNGVGPLQVIVSVLQANFGGITCAVGPYPKATYWGNFNAPPTGPYYGGGGYVAMLQQPKLSTVFLRIRVGTYQAFPAWFFDYSTDGTNWITPLYLCSPSSHGCPMDYPSSLGDITDAGFEYYTGNAASNATGGSIFQLLSWNF